MVTNYRHNNSVFVLSVLKQGYKSWSVGERFKRTERRVGTLRTVGQSGSRIQTYIENLT